MKTKKIAPGIEVPHANQARLFMAHPLTALSKVGKVSMV
jgi:hypothetical protein